MTLPRALTPLRHRSFRLLLAGQVTSNVGDACYAVALPWYVLAAHGGVALLGIVLVAYGIPRTGLIAVGGWASDRWGSRTVMMASDMARVAGAAALAAAAGLGPARAFVLIPVAVVLGAGEGLFLPASYSVVPSLVPDEGLRAANGLATGGTQFAALAGPAIGGALVAFGSPALAFALDAASFAVSAVTLARLRVIPAVTEPAGAPVTGTEGAAPAAGEATSAFGLFRSQRVLQVIFLLALAANLGVSGVYEVAVPALAHGPLRSGAGGYGLILAAIGGGTLLGALLAGQIRQPRRPGVTALLAFQAGAACVLVTPYIGSTLGVAAVLAGDAVMTGFGNVFVLAAFQRWAPPAVLGRATGVLMLGAFGVSPVAAALAAIFTRDLGAASFFLFAAATLTAATIFGLSQKSWREFGVTQAGTGPGGDRLGPLPSGVPGMDSLGRPAEP
jgi:predicted MFS family arabinose efflux permease